MSKIKKIKAEIANLDASKLVYIRGIISQSVQKQTAAVVMESRARNLASQPPKILLVRLDKDSHEAFLSNAGRMR